MNNANKKGSNLSIRIPTNIIKKELSDTLFKALLIRITLHYSLKQIYTIKHHHLWSTCDILKSYMTFMVSGRNWCIYTIVQSTEEFASGRTNDR